jgi:hypothetical protein
LLQLPVRRLRFLVGRFGFRELPEFRLAFEIDIEHFFIKKKKKKLQQFCDDSKTREETTAPQPFIFLG